MLNLTNKIQSIINTANIPVGLQGSATELLVAEALAFALDIPTQPVTAPELHYASQYKVEILRKLAIVNEQTVLRLDLTSELIYAFWLVRYSLAHKRGWLGAGKFINLALQVDNALIPEPHKTLVTTYPSLGISEFGLNATETEELL